MINDIIIQGSRGGDIKELNFYYGNKLIDNV